MITIVTKGEGDEEPGMLTIPVSTSIPVTGEGDIVIEQSKLLSNLLSGHLKIDKINGLMKNGSLMKVESIAECSPWSILQYF